MSRQELGIGSLAHIALGVRVLKVIEYTIRYTVQRAYISWEMPKNRKLYGFSIWVLAMMQSFTLIYKVLQIRLIKNPSPSTHMHTKEKKTKRKSSNAPLQVGSLQCCKIWSTASPCNKPYSFIKLVVSCLKFPKFIIM